MTTEAASKRLAERYLDVCSTPSDIFEHVPFLAELAISRHAECVIELGTRSGVSTIGWLYGLASTGGELWSVDIDPQPRIGCRPDNWRFVQGDDLDPEVVKQLPAADIVFIDTSHAYDHTLAELNTYRYKLKRNGLFVLHDTELRHPLDVPRFPPFPVKVAMEEFCREEGFSFTNRTNCNGLGIIQTWA